MKNYIYRPAWVSEVNCRFLRRDYLHRDGFFVFGPMELKIGGVTLLRVLNQWFRRVFVIFDISVYSGLGCVIFNNFKGFEGI